MIKQWIHEKSHCPFCKGMTEVGRNKERECYNCKDKDGNPYTYVINEKDYYCS